jgi:hypothetical protein
MKVRVTVHSSIPFRLDTARSSTGIATVTTFAQEGSPAILELIETVDGEAMEAFRAVDFYKEKDQPDGIEFWFGENLKQNFLTGIGRIELDAPVAALNVCRVLEKSQDASIIAALGCNYTIRTCLTYMAQFIRKQPEGQKGILHTNKRANVFYAEDDNGELWTFYCMWVSAGNPNWFVDAVPVAGPGEWDAGSRIFSPAAPAA